MKTNSDTAHFLETLMFAYPTDDDGRNPMDERTIFDFSPAFIADVTEFCDAFRAYLDAQGIEIPDSPHSFGGNVYFGLSGHGCGFWDDQETQHLQAPLESFARSKYQFEEIYLSDNDAGELDLAILPEFIADYRARLFAHN